MASLCTIAALVIAGVVSTDTPAPAVAHTLPPNAGITMAEFGMSNDPKSVCIFESSPNVEKTRFFQIVQRDAVTSYPHLCPRRQNDLHFTNRVYGEGVFPEIAAGIPFQTSLLNRNILRGQSPDIDKIYVPDNSIWLTSFVWGERVNPHRFGAEVPSRSW